MEVLYGNYSVRQRPLVTWLRHPKGKSRSVWAGPFDMCRLCITRCQLVLGWYRERQVCLHHRP